MSTWNCCRTCLDETSLNNLFQNTPNNQYGEVIFKLTGLQIQINDFLPQMICTTCMNNLEQMILFQNMCLRSHNILLERLNRQKFLEVKTEPKNCLKNKNTEKTCSNNAESDHDYDIDLNDGQCDINSFHYNPELNNTERIVCSDNVIEFESTVEDILRKRLKFTFVNLKPENKRKKRKLKQSDTKSTSKTRSDKNKRCEASKMSNYCDENVNSYEVDSELETQQDAAGTTVAEKEEEPQCTEYQCEYCFKMYNNKVSYVNHTKIHTGLKVMCEHCGKEFLDKRRLLMHCRSKHGYQKTDKCTYCDYFGISPESVKIHERIHTGEKPYKCKECPASFHRSSSYLQHTARHLPDKTVQCQQCPALFKSVTLMRIHANRHKPRDHKFKCLVCGGNFSSRSSVGRHLRRAHAVARCTQAHLQRVKLNEP